MTFFIGTDEAGYGPNLGPLLISATAWRFPSGTTAAQCWKLLEDSVCQRMPDKPDQVHFADSKQVYSPGRSIEPLEKAVLAVLQLQDHTPASFQDLGTTVAGSAFQQAMNQETCLSPTPITLPLETEEQMISQASQRLSEALQTVSAGLVTIKSRVIFPTEFNELVEREGSKGRVLSIETLRLVADIVDEYEPESAEVICDKHGGRNRYDELLSAAFDDQLVFRLEEGRQLSRYRLNQMEFRFQTRAEEHLPVAVASMVSKYLREVAMMEFNAWWQTRIPNIKPTQGYPVDAARFWEEIEDEVQRQQIPKESLWRIR